jgi:hypothetical protein
VSRERARRGLGQALKPDHGVHGRQEAGSYEGLSAALDESPPAAEDLPPAAADVARCLAPMLDRIDVWSDFLGAMLANPQSSHGLWRHTCRDLFDLVLRKSLQAPTASKLRGF